MMVSLAVSLPPFSVNPTFLLIEKGPRTSLRIPMSVPGAWMVHLDDILYLQHGSSSKLSG